jgi:hypothetical protein
MNDNLRPPDPHDGMSLSLSFLVDEETGIVADDMVISDEAPAPRATDK